MIDKVHLYHDQRRRTHFVGRFGKHLSHCSIKSG